MRPIKTYRRIAASLLAVSGLALPDLAGAAHHSVSPAPEPVPHSPACHAQQLALAAPGGINYFQDCADAPQMVAFRGGPSRMGDLLGNGLSYEKPVHETHIGPFALGRYEITVGEWQACVNAHECGPATGEDVKKPANYPVEGVSWDDAEQYVAWLAKHTGKPYRLPSEAEWEYAARAGSSDQFTWGNNVDDACQHANSLDLSGNAAQPQMFWYVDCDDGFAKAAPVGSFAPNAWGLYDMLGNVWEWVQDCWHGDYTNAPTDGSAWIDGGDCRKRVNRGGGWGNHPRSLRVSNRDADGHGDHSEGLGFRVARTMPAVPDASPSPSPSPSPPAAKP